ncbi:universal stress protein [uncultured Lutibacter sp.]|uniref:universal stress protein n=1 Tax=uncultured Lutibacter sp. TaxID=437739 RepID=UPI00262C388C|nr:universal stress protein [uncultured Lutibacter sp.]
MKTIIHATDFSDNAISALKYAYALSKKTKSVLWVVHIFNNATLASTLNDPILLPIEESIQQKNAKLKEFCKSHLEGEFDSLNIKIEAIEDSSVVTGIISKADELYASMIVTGMKGKRVFKELLIGSTTRKLIEKAPCPILAIPLNATLDTIKTIVYTTDFEEEDISAIFRLTEIAKIYNATIKIIHVSSKKDVDSQQEMEWFKEILTQKVTYKNLEFEVVFSDDTYTTLLQYLDVVKADLLAMLERDKKGLFKKIFHKDLVKKMESKIQIPLISFNEINY